MAKNTFSPLLCATLLPIAFAACSSTTPGNNSKKTDSNRFAREDENYLGRPPLLTHYTIQLAPSLTAKLKLRDDGISEPLRLQSEEHSYEISHPYEVPRKAHSSSSNAELFRLCTFFHRGSLLTSQQDYRAVAEIFLKARTTEFLARYTEPQSLAASDLRPKVVTTAEGDRRVTFTAVVMEHNLKRTRRDLFVSRFTYLEKRGQALTLEARDDWIIMVQLDPVQVIGGAFPDVVMKDGYTLYIKDKLESHLPLIDVNEATSLLEK